MYSCNGVLEVNNMKYIMESLRKSTAGILLFGFLFILTIRLFCTTIELKLVAEVIESGSIDVLHKYMVILIAMILSDGLTSYFYRYRNAMHNYLHLKLITKVINADYKMFVKYSPGTILKTDMDISHISSAIGIVIDVVRNILTIIITIIFIASINVTVIIPVMLILMVVALISYGFTKKMSIVSERIDTIKCKENNLTDEIINGFAEIRTYPKVAGELLNQSQCNINEVYNLTTDKRKLSMRWNWNISVLCNAISIGLILYILQLKGNGVMVDNTMMFTLLMYVWRLMDPIINISTEISDAADLFPKLKGYVNIIEYKDELEDGTIVLDSFNDSITIKHLNFGYDTSSTVLKDVNIRIKKGQHIGICGSTGCGKSTLLKLLNRFYDADSGSIEIDGVDIRNLTNESRRSFIGTVHQKPYIFNGTIRENILFGISKVVTESELVDACKKASIYNFIKSLPDGFETKVGPRGMKLSGGETQRIAIAKIFLLDPEIIILDEATSALDNETESLIQEAMGIFENKTIIAVAHRLSTIENSDVIYVFANHTIEEFGTHEELMELGGIYASMHK